jgi:hypothetical protein
LVRKETHAKSQKSPTPKISQKKLPAFTNTWHCKDSGAGKDGNDCGQSIAKRSKKQHQKVTI